MIRIFMSAPSKGIISDLPMFSHCSALGSLFYSVLPVCCYFFISFSVVAESMSIQQDIVQHHQRPFSYHQFSYTADSSNNAIQLSSAVKVTPANDLHLVSASTEETMVLSEQLDQDYGWLDDIAPRRFHVMPQPSLRGNNLKSSFWRYSQLTQGGVGLLQTPTARFADDGDFTFNYHDNQEYRFWALSLQLFPWLETTVRYTDVRTRLYSDDPGFSGDQTYKDKGIDAKFLLWRESRYLPNLALNLRDFGGTGLLESESLLLSKRWHDVDVHLGIGWGYLGRADTIANPFCQLRNSFCERPGGFSGSGGKIDYQRFFKGPASLIGGIEYHTPWQPLSIKVEFDGNNYQNDIAGSLKQDSRVNFGALYRVTPDFTVSLNFLRGNTLGFGASYRMNFHTATQAKIAPTARTVPVMIPNANKTVDRIDIAEKLVNEVGFSVEKYQLLENEVIIEGYSFAYWRDAEFYERIGRLLAAELPERIKLYRIRILSSGMPMVETQLDAAKFIAYARGDQLSANINDSIRRIEPPLVDTPWQLVTEDPGFYYSADGYLIQTFGSPETFFMYQTGLSLGSGYVFNPHLSLDSALRVTLLTNFDEFKFKVDAMDTGIPRVRTYVREYVSGNDVALENLYFKWKSPLTKAWFGQVYGGVLETMFSGIGGELLFRPIDRGIAFGIDVNYVQQRDFDDVFALRDYKVATGHVTAYYQPQWVEDILIKLSVGRYLAKDKGITLDFAKKFDSGIVVGAYASKTNLSAAQYGEGSFTKGFYINIPFDLFTLKPSTGIGTMPWVPISRDGGQPLRRPSRLYDLTESRSPFLR